jgi:hypothetical protein
MVEHDPEPEHRDVHDAAVTPSGTRLTRQLIGGGPAGGLAMQTAAILHVTHLPFRRRPAPLTAIPKPLTGKPLF